MVENTVGKGEVAHYEQFLLFPQCFQKICTANTEKKSLFGKGLNYEVWLNDICFQANFFVSTQAISFSSEIATSKQQVNKLRVLVKNVTVWSRLSLWDCRCLEINTSRDIR